MAFYYLYEQAKAFIFLDKCAKQMALNFAKMQALANILQYLNQNIAWWRTDIQYSSQKSIPGLHSFNTSMHMTRHIKLWGDLNVSLIGISQYFFVLFFCIKTTS